MKKKDITLLILCIIYLVLSIIYIFNSSSSGKVISLIQFIVIYIPFFILLFIKEKKYAIYITLAFCGFELIASFLNYIQYIAAFITSFSDMFNMSTILVLLGKIFSNLIKVYLIFNIINYLREENIKHVKIIISSFVGYFLVILSYSVLSNFNIVEVITPIKELVFNIILITFVITIFSENEYKKMTSDN